MKAATVKLKTIALIAFAAWNINGFAQVETVMYVMKNGEIVFESPVSEIDSIVFVQVPIESSDWVLINGVKWATRNVGASSPCDYGGYYQFNKGTTDFLPYYDYFNSVYAQSNTWLPANDPSPAGYRVPTLSEIQSLFNTTYVSNEWITLNGINGRKFTDRKNGNSIFLPAAGYRSYSDGTLGYVGSGGLYWSGTVGGSGYAYGLYFYSGDAYWGGSNRVFGFSVRPVAE